MKPAAILALSLIALPGLASAQGQVNIICSVQAEWCNMMSTVFAKSTGIKVNMTAKGSGEALAQLMAERANPKTDVWFGGTGDPHLQAAEQGLSLEYKSPLLPQLYPWAQKQAADSKYRTVGVYLGPLGFGFNTELLAKKKATAPTSWADLLKPEYKGDVQVANPLCFMVQKFLIQQYRPANKRAQDVLYIYDTIELFGALLDEFNAHWHARVAPTLGDLADEVRKLCTLTFDDVNDMVRDAARIPADRNLSPEQIQATCRYAFEHMLR